MLNGFRRQGVLGGEVIEVKWRYWSTEDEIRGSNVELSEIRYSIYK